jgi:hypothetical protein
MKPPAEFKGILDGILEDTRNEWERMSDVREAWNAAVAAGDRSVLPYAAELRDGPANFKEMHEILKRWHASRSTPSPS